MRFLIGFLVVLAGVAAAVLVASSGLNEPLEREWRERVHQWSPREASGQIQIVEIDAASLAAINRWPWSRRHYANLVDRLDQAGVRSIAFDVDFSASSNAADDALFAVALERARAPVYLPTFAQAAGSGDRRSLESLPIEPLRRSASLASVMMRPDSDGFVRSLPMGTITGDAPRPSLAAAMAGVDGAIDEAYALDLSLDLQTIPRHSFIDIERGTFDRNAVRGKHIVVGATAIEIFDRYPMPRYGVIPGVIVQALGAETLLAGRFVEIGWVLPLTLAALLALWIAQTRTAVRSAAMGAAISIALLVAGFALQSGARTVIEVVPALACLFTVTAITVARHFHREFLHRRMHDAATDLPNRRAFEKRDGVGSERFTLAMAIDNFEALRAVLGEAGSHVLVKQLAERVTEYGAVDRIYRIDERILAWTVSRSEYEPEYELHKLQKIVRAPFQAKSRAVDPHTTFGVASNDALDEAIHAARIAATQGRTVAFHAAAEQASMEQRVSLLGELDSAIEREELQVWFQPQLDLASDQIVSVESLVRWQHPTRGFLSPDQFVPLAEESNRVDTMTLYVLEKSIAALEAWSAEGIVLRAAVNISARLLSSPTFIDEAERVMSAADTPRDRLVFEVTESATLEDPERSAQALARLRALGIAISIDDYGTGQSSLSYLKKMPLSELKIDRSFVQHAHQDPSDALLVRSTIQLAHELGLAVVAEGVEDPKCLEFLRSVDCDIAQGYLIGKPMTFDGIREIAGEYRRNVA